jgi:hypothetical protein
MTIRGETIAFASHKKGKEKKGKGIRKKSRKSASQIIFRSDDYCDNLKIPKG